MSKLSRLEKLSILADAAKYDASCASSGAQKRNSREKFIRDLRKAAQLASA